MNLKNFLSLNKAKKSTIPSFGIQSFTYYLPAPPKRKTGYREKQFDKILNAILQRGFVVLSTNMVAHSGANADGCWLHLLLMPQTATAAAINLDQLIDDDLTNDNEPLALDGLYPSHER